MYLHVVWIFVQLAEFCLKLRLAERLRLIPEKVQKIQILFVIDQMVQTLANGQEEHQSIIVIMIMIISVVDQVI